MLKVLRSQERDYLPTGAGGLPESKKKKKEKRERHWN